MPKVTTVITVFAYTGLTQPQNPENELNQPVQGRGKFRQGRILRGKFRR